MKINDFELPDAEMEMLQEWEDMVIAGENYDPDKAGWIEAHITFFIFSRVSQARANWNESVVRKKRKGHLTMIETIKSK